jgi:hypothetical protein
MNNEPNIVVPDRAQLVDSEPVSEARSVVAEIAAAGWLPEEPNPECRRAIERPRILWQVKRTDGNGLHFMLVYCELMRRFARGKAGTAARWQALFKAAIWFIHIEITPRVEVSVDGALALGREIDSWFQTRWAPLGHRFRSALETDTVDAFRTADPYGHDLCRIWATLERDRGFLDAESDVRRMERGHALHASGRKRHVGFGPKLSFDDLAPWFEVLTKDGRALSRVCDDGVVRLSPRKVKGALDKLFGRTIEPRGPVVEQLGDRSLPGGEDPVAAAELAEAARAMQIAVASTGAPRDARRVIRDCRDALDAGATSLRELEQQTGIDRRTLSAAYKLEKRSRPSS